MKLATLLVTLLLSTTNLFAFDENDTAHLMQQKCFLSIETVRTMSEAYAQISAATAIASDRKAELSLKVKETKQKLDKEIDEMGLECFLAGAEDTRQLQN